MTNEEKILNHLSDCIVNFEIRDIQKVVKEAITCGLTPTRIIEVMVNGLNTVGQKYEEGEYFLAELIAAGEAMSKGMAVLEPSLKAGEVKTRGKIVIGTVQGDLHDIGKNIAISLLQGASFQVIDLGIDVDAATFVKAVREQRPDILGLSALLTATMPEMANVISEIEKAGLRNKVKIIIGGSHVSQEYAKQVGADAGADNAVEGVNICKKFAGS